MSGRVQYAVEAGVARITLDRPDKHNAITPDMAAELARALPRGRPRRRGARGGDRGAGERAFSAGSDLNGLADLAMAGRFATASNMPPWCATSASR